MAKIIMEPSKTFSEFLLIPNLTKSDCIPSNISLKTPIVRFKKGEESSLNINIPFVSAAMQAVSGEKMAVALAREGGLSFVFCSQTIEKQVAMIKNIKRHKAGFVISDSTVSPNNTLKDVLDITKKTGHSTIPVTDTGLNDGKLLGLITKKDYRVSRDTLETKVEKIMTPFETLVYGHEGLTLSEANDVIWEKKINCLPIINKKQQLKYLVFRKDYEDHKDNPNALVDDSKSFVVGAAVNTRDYQERIPALVEAGADVLCIDSSDGYSEWQRDVVQFVRKKYGDKVKIGAGNVVDGDAFKYLADAGADFVKVGIGGGSICITREQKGIGRGQASAIIDVAEARDKYFKDKGIYVPICSDGAIVFDNHIVIALALGADFIMMGRYFARFDESPTKIVTINNTYYKEYWAEGSNRAKNWQRYDLGDNEDLSFEEGVDSYVPYAGKLGSNLRATSYKVKSTMSNCGCNSIEALHKDAKLTVVSNTSLLEGGAHDVLLKNPEKKI